MVKKAFSKPFWGNENMLKELISTMISTIPMGRIAETADLEGAVV